MLVEPTQQNDAEAQRDKVRENRVRRALQRQGYVLVKSRARDPRALGYGQFLIADQQNNIVAGGHGPSGFDLTIDDVERWAKS
jgi:hypothetical protein